MTSRSFLLPRPLLAASLLVVSGCAQGMVTLSPSTILSAAVMVGDAVDAASRPAGSRGSSRSGSSGVSIPRSPAPTAAAASVLTTADRYVGVPYVWGGNTPDGFDCSGFTRYVFAKHGVQLPRTSREQARVGESVGLDFGAFRPGDILLFAEPDQAVSHVAIYVGDGQMIHASSAAGQVAYFDLHSDRAAWYLQNLVAVRRLLRD